MRQNYVEALIKSAKKNSKIKENLGGEFSWIENEWQARSFLCSKRILTAICFKINSINVFQKNKSVLLPIIGLYYSLFHLGLALLFIEHRTKIEDLRGSTENKKNRLNHAKLIKLIKGKLVDSNLMTNDFLELIEQVKDIREYANYNFGSFPQDKYGKFLDLQKQFTNLYRQTEKVFDESIQFIHDISDSISSETNIDLNFQIALDIGDGIGDDIMSTYLSDEDEKMIVEYLVENRLTT